MNTQVLQDTTAFLWAEADMLDHAEYDDWLGLWTADGLYIVPIDPDATDHANTLNYAYDNAAMRAKRVRRLVGNESISTMPAARTIRALSRLRVIADDGATVTVRGAQDLHEFRRETLRQQVADVTWELDRTDGGYRIRRKVIRLINSTDALTAIGYLL
ncbi:aromatic-ring-hydroxylating dioxygenase subunit beta [Derxia gummosa]|uniref:Aromatic-ring-hydroxylating dioxygenase subunit beta n=1 Tax=Derxia gummosa DSM 723 TaxID=1121388 RepID=A0A8B6X5D6_9BURK|nr:aromatic-ring-hydroxylating dioxygenase subunit beta [Derxia gummosa]